jgi:hypothetical protein
MLRIAKFFGLIETMTMPSVYNNIIGSRIFSGKFSYQVHIYNIEARATLQRPIELGIGDNQNSLLISIALALEANQ